MYYVRKLIFYFIRQQNHEKVAFCIASNTVRDVNHVTKASLVCSNAIIIVVYVIICIQNMQKMHALYRKFSNMLISLVNKQANNCFVPFPVHMRIHNSNIEFASCLMQAGWPSNPLAALDSTDAS